MSIFNRKLRPLGYQLMQLNGSQTQCAKLCLIEYKSSVLNNIMRTEVLQVFKSGSNEAFSETEYYFPMDEGVCLEQFTAKYGEKEVKGIIKKKEDARMEYEASKKEGKVVSYAETERKDNADYLKIKLGNLPQNTNVDIRLTYCQQLEIIFNKYYLIFIPLLVPDEVPDKNNLENDLERSQKSNILTVDLQCTGKIRCALSQGYPVKEEILDENRRQISLETAYVQQDVHFEMIFAYDSMFEPQVIFGMSETNAELAVKRVLRESVMVSFIPNFNENTEDEIDDAVRSALAKGQDILNDAYKQQLNQEVINHLESSKSEFLFLLDRSGSMSGQPVRRAVDALCIFLKSLPTNSYFNIISFGSTVQKMFETSQKYESKTLQEALQRLKPYQADLGGTEIYQPLNQIFKGGSIPWYNKQIFLLTDGEVDSPQQVVELIRKNNKQNRVHSIGFGSGADKYLITESAKAGKGQHKFVGLNDDLSEVVINMLSSSITPTLNDFSLKYDNSIFEAVYPLPSEFDCVFKDEIISIHLFLKPLVTVDSLTEIQRAIQITYSDTHLKKIVKSDIHLRTTDLLAQHSQLRESVFKLGKNQYLNQALKNNPNDDYLIQQALDFQLLTPATAIVAAIASLNDEQFIHQQSLLENDQCKIDDLVDQSGSILKRGNMKLSCAKPQKKNIFTSFLSGVSNLFSGAGSSSSKLCSMPPPPMESFAPSSIPLSSSPMGLFATSGIPPPPPPMGSFATSSIPPPPPPMTFQTTSSIPLPPKMGSFIQGIPPPPQANQQINYVLDDIKCVKACDISQTLSSVPQISPYSPQVHNVPQAPGSLQGNNKPQIQIRDKISQVKGAAMIQKDGKEKECIGKDKDHSSSMSMSDYDDDDNDEHYNRKQSPVPTYNSIQSQKGGRKNLQEQGESNSRGISSLLSFEDILNEVNSEGVWKYNLKMIQNIPISEEQLKQLHPLFQNQDALMTLIILCLLESRFNSQKSKWVLISKKSTSWIKTNLSKDQNFIDLKSQIMNIISI